MSPTTIQKSIECFEAAISEDPEHAPSHDGLLPPRQAMPKAESAARRALELDDTLAEAHAALALVLHHYHWNWKDAEVSYRRAIDLTPDLSTAHLW